MSVAAVAAPILIRQEIADALLVHARHALPNEACGLLAGDASSGRVRRFHPTRNEHASPYRFSVDPRDLVRLTYAMEADGDALVAVFHSHPRGEPRPSATDLREARYPMALHVLAGRPFPRATDGNAEWSLRAWRIADLDLAEVPITVP